jgi:hypothetical protein
MIVLYFFPGSFTKNGVAGIFFGPSLDINSRLRSLWWIIAHVECLSENIWVAFLCCFRVVSAVSGTVRQ